MSQETLSKLQQAAKAFKNDVEQLPGLRDALAAHDADEAYTPPAEPATPAEPAAAPTEPQEPTASAEPQESQ